MTDDDRTTLSEAYAEKCITERLELTPLMFGCEVCMSEHMIAHGCVQHLKTMAGMIERNIFRLCAKWFCPSQHRQTIQYPRDWREAAKERWSPAWAKKRWPVIYVQHKVYEMFPEIAWPKHQRAVYIERFEFKGPHD